MVVYSLEKQVTDSGYYYETTYMKIFATEAIAKKYMMELIQQESTKFKFNNEKTFAESKNLFIRYIITKHTVIDK